MISVVKKKISKSKRKIRYLRTTYREGKSDQTYLCYTTEAKSLT